VNIDMIDGILHFPAGEVCVPEECFTENKELREVILPEGLVYVDAAAFAECENLHKVTLPSTLTAVNYGAFFGCGALTSIELPEGLEQIQEGAFWGCGLRQVRIPASVNFIGENAFLENENLIRADVLNPAARIEKNAFGFCPHLREGFIAPGYPNPEIRGDELNYDLAELTPQELLYTLLWCSCPERHSPETGARAERFIRSNMNLIMEWILRENNTVAMTTIVKRHLPDPSALQMYVEKTLTARQTELTALLLQEAGAADGDAFDL